MSETQDWKKSTVAELRDACTEKNLITTGKKQELIDRLEENAAEAAEKDPQQGETGMNVIISPVL